MAITIKEIAEYAKVSIGTVSRALNNDPLIADKTRAKIQNLARELDYVPNHFGRGLRAKKSRLVGYLISNILDSFYNEVMHGISQVLSEKGYSLVVGMTERSLDYEQRQLELFREKSIDGLIVSNYRAESVRYLRLFPENDIPLIVCDFEPFDSLVPNVRVDDEEAMRLVTSHLIELGHKDFAFCFHTNTHSYQRYLSHKKVTDLSNLKTPVFCEDERDLRNLLGSENRPTAVVCYSDYFAIKVKHIAEEMGLNVPNDIAITGFDDIYFADWPEISLTTISQPRVDIGRITAEMLFDMIEGNPCKKKILLPPKLVVRKSTKK